MQRKIFSLTKGHRDRLFLTIATTSIATAKRNENGYEVLVKEVESAGNDAKEKQELSSLTRYRRENKKTKK